MIKVGEVLFPQSLKRIVAKRETVYQNNEANVSSSSDLLRADLDPAIN